MPSSFPLSDLGNAQRLIAQGKGDIRFCYPFKGRSSTGWFRWDGRRWRTDRKQGIMELAKTTVRGIGGERLLVEEAEDDHGAGAAQKQRISKHSTNSQSIERLRAMIVLAESESGIPIDPDELDANPTRLNTLNGTLDLESGKLLPHDRSDYITKIAPVMYDANAQSRIWTKFIDHIIPDADVRWYMQKAVGYSLTALTGEECLFFLYGSGANGKSTFINSILNMMGEYGRQASSSTLMTGKRGTIRNDVAALVGTRFVAATETTTHSQMDEELIKQMTGGDRLVARRLYEEEFEFYATWKIWFSANHRPNITETTNAMWRRVRLIPFTVVIPEAEQNENIKQVLMNDKEERSGIFNWAVEGLRAWQTEGLDIPSSIKAATDAYRNDMDLTGQFINEYCYVTPEAQIKKRELYTAYVSFCKQQGDHHLSNVMFGKELRHRGDGMVKEQKRADGYWWQGIRLARTPSFKQFGE